MRKIIVILSLLILATANVSMAAWGDVVDKLITNTPAPPPPPMPPAMDEARPEPEETSSAPTPGVDDEHFIQNDDYFIQTQNLGSNAWMYVDLAKMVTPPSADTKREAEFMKVRDGQNIWTKYYWKSRIASKSELRMGMHLIAFNDNQRGDVYRAPDKKDSARGGAWFYARITDTSDVFKGYVTVSGNYKVGLKNIRLIMK